MKRQKMMHEQRGYGFLPDKSTCEEHLEEPFLKEFISNQGCDLNCDYCGRQHDEPFAMSLDRLAAKIMDGVQYRYEPAVKELGLYHLHNDTEILKKDTYDILRDDVSALGELFSDLHQAFYDKQWCKDDPYGTTEDEAALYGWSVFQRITKCENRYFFQNVFDERFGADYELKAPDELLETICQYISDNGLLRVLPEEIDIYRSRIEEDDFYTEAEQLGTPKTEYLTSPKRMSPIGIPMFYGSLERETALTESVEAQDELDERVGSLAIFNPTEDLTVVDFVNLPSIPSYFDQNNRHRIPPLKFLHDFVGDLSRVVEEDHDVLYYIPIQIVVEFIKLNLENYVGREIDGVIYPSSLITTGSNNVALFLENDDCVDDADELNNGRGLILQDVQRLEEEELRDV